MRTLLPVILLLSVLARTQAGYYNDKWFKASIPSHKYDASGNLVDVTLRCSVLKAYPTDPKHFITWVSPYQMGRTDWSSWRNPPIWDTSRYTKSWLPNVKVTFSADCAAANANCNADEKAYWQVETTDMKLTTVTLNPGYGSGGTRAHYGFSCNTWSDPNLTNDVSAYVNMPRKGTPTPTGCTAGKWGADCKSDCSANCVDKVCDKGTGHCTKGCQAGFYGADCKSACSANCVDNVCDKATGHCTKGCQPGWDCTKDPLGNTPKDLHLDVTGTYDAQNNLNTLKLRCSLFKAVDDNAMALYIYNTETKSNIASITNGFGLQTYGIYVQAQQGQGVNTLETADMSDIDASGVLDCAGSKDPGCQGNEKAFIVADVKKIKVNSPTELKKIGCYVLGCKAPLTENKTIQAKKTT